MKKLLCIMFLLPVLFMSSAFAQSQDDPYQTVHDLFKDYTDDGLLTLKNLLDIEIEYRNLAKSDERTQELICNYFENIGLKIKYVMFQPLVEKDPGGLYGGEERWFVTFESGEQIGTWVSNDQITYCYKNQWYNDVPLY